MSRMDVNRTGLLRLPSLAGVFVLSTATLMFEIALIRLFSVTQFYHFAFMIVSLAMLGFGASGTWMALSPQWGRRVPRQTVAALALAYSLTVFGGYSLINGVPFDSFRIAWDWRQVLILFAHYIALSLPFFCSGAILSLLFALHPERVGSLYAVNLTGSALGCALALMLPTVVGGEGVVWLGGGLGGCAVLLLTLNTGAVGAPARCLRALGVLGGALIVLASALVALRPPTVAVVLSPYKALSYVLQLPDARILSQAWNGFSRVDVVASPAIRSLPGLSYRYLAPPPPQHGLFVDGDDLSPVVQLPVERMQSQDPALQFAAYLPTAIAYRLRPGGRALILGPRGGLELWIALSQGSRHVTGVEANPLVIEAVGDLYTLANVESQAEAPRSFVRRTSETYDVLTLALTAPYRPIRSGAYSLGEDYSYTVEAFEDFLSRLTPDGLLVVSRWVQTPPSESLRAFALAVEAVELDGGDPSRQILAFRGYAMLTLLVKRTPFSAAELDAVRSFAAERAFDLVYAPDLVSESTNRYNVLPAPIYYEAFSELISTEDREGWYAAYPFNVRPPTDDHPFFDHYFRWSQARQVFSELGTSWQPFGGAGYFVLLALLGLSVTAAVLLIGLPALLVRRQWDAVWRKEAGGGRDLLYFGLLGLGYLFVEIPLMQRTILFLGHPAYAVTVVLFAVLFFSGLGSAVAGRLRTKILMALTSLVLLVAVYAFSLPLIFQALLGLPLAARVAVTVAVLAPGGFLMGLPFPVGLQRIGELAPQRVPWAWAANGAMSVVASILSALLALSLGFGWVLAAGALCYAGACVIASRWHVELPLPKDTEDGFSGLVR